MAWSDLEARSGTPQHPHLLNMCQAWLGAGCIELLYPAPDTNLSMYMRRGRPSPECVRLELWRNLWGIASAIEFLHGLTLNNTRGWRHDISPDSFLIFNSDIGKAIWKLGNLEVDSLHGKDLVIQEHRRAETEPKMIKNPVGNFIKEHPPPESRKVHANSIRTRSSDIWSLGCVFVEVLAWVFLPETSELASMPVDHTRFWLRDHDAVARTAQWTQDVLNGVTRENPEPSPARTLADLIKRMLNPIPQARCQISEVTTQLQDILSQQGGPHPQQDSGYPGFINKKDDRGLFLASDTESLPGLTEASTGSVDEDEAEFAEISAHELFVGMRPLVIEDETRLELGDPVSLGADELDTSLSNRKPEFLVPVDVDKTTLPGPQRVPLNLSMTSGQRRASNIEIPRTSAIKLAEDSSDRRYSVEDTESGLNPTGKVGGGASLASGQHVGSDTFTVPLVEEANLDSAVKAKLEDWWRSRSLESVKTKMGWNSLTGAERQRCVGREVMARPSKARVPEKFYAPAGPLSSFWGETMVPHFQMFVAHELKLLSQRRVPSGTFIFELLIVETKNWLSLSGGSIQRRPVICMIFQNDRTRKVWKRMERKLDSELSLGFELRFMVASVVLL
jgi:serine/threonine protein kinase